MTKRIFLSLALLLTTLVSTWAEDVNYIYYTVNEDGKTITKHEDGSQAEYTMLISNSNEANLDDGWYVLNTSFEYGERIIISGDVKLILKDGCTLTAQKGIRINTDATLTVYAQSEGDSMGRLVAQISEHDKAAIGGNKNFEAGKLFIHGGEIEATCKDGSKYAAGIGGGYGEGSGMEEITIYYGKVTATGAEYGAGIGGGKNNNHPGTINIYGGDITADGGNGGAGIGGGANHGDWPVNIYGGIVNAKGHGEGDMVEEAGAAGIGGGGEGNQTARISIHGGTITAEGFKAAGIGGGYEGSCGEVYIYGGTVTATGGESSAAIGGGYEREGGDIYVTGGTVTATSGTGGAAIGGGYNSGGGRIWITGGHVTATVYRGKNHSPTACNIGSGAGAMDSRLTLNDHMCVKVQSGIVDASKRFEACRERLYDSDEGWWTIEVYKCPHGAYYYTVINDKRHLNHCGYCSGTGEGNHALNDLGQCTKCSYGSDWTIFANTFYETSTSAYGEATQTLKAVQDRTIVLPSCSNVPEGMTFAGWLIADLSVVNGIEAADEEPLHPAGEVYTVTSNTQFFARYRYDFTPTWTWNEYLTSTTLTIQSTGGEPIDVTPVTMGTPTTVAANPDEMGSITNTATATYKSGDDTHGYTTYSFSTEYSKPQYYDYTLQDIYDNTPTLSLYKGKTGNVRLRNRTFYRNGNWNTLCLPFDVEDISSSPLAGATLKKLTDASFDSSTGTLTLTFADATSIKAGQAYLIKWPDTGDSHFNLTDVLFTGVTLVNYLCDDDISTDDSGTATVTFMGTYKKLSFDADDRTVLVLGADNKLYHPQSGASIGAQRAYFVASTSMGDVNGDGVVDISDVVSLVNHILGNNSDSFIFANADMDKSGETDISDVVSLVNLILSGSNNGKALKNVVTNLGDDTISFDGSSSGQAR